MTQPARSGYEKNVLLEGRIARIVAWLLNLMMLALLVASVLGVTSFGPGQLVIAEFLLGYFSWISYKCEYRAQGELKAIWEAEMTERVVNGSDA